MEPPRSARSAGDVLQRVAAEVGIDPAIDPYSSQDPAQIQLRHLLNTAGEELAIQYDWEALQNETGFVTTDTDTGQYPLPDDFNYMIPQTGWERAQNIPLGGPLSPQDWQYLLGRDLVTSTIYASFRIAQGTFNLFPFPPVVGMDIHYEYMSLFWVQDPTSLPDPTFKSQADKSTDIPMYNSTLLARYIKVKYYMSKGLPTGNAQADFDQLFSMLTGVNASSKVLNAGGGNSGFPYIDPWRNLPDSGYGL